MITHGWCKGLHDIFIHVLFHFIRNICGVTKVDERYCHSTDQTLHRVSINLICAKRTHRSTSKPIIGTLIIQRATTSVVIVSEARSGLFLLNRVSPFFLSSIFD